MLVCAHRNTHAGMSELSHRQADRHQFLYRHKSQLPQGTRLGRPILLCSYTWFSLDNSKHLRLSLLDIILHPTCIHPLIGVPFALTIPTTTCPIQSLFYSFLLCLPMCLTPPGCFPATRDSVCFMSAPGGVSRLPLKPGHNG